MHEALRVGIRERLHQRGIGRREDRRGRAEAEADRQDDCRRESGRSLDATQRHAEILRQYVHECPRDRSPGLLAPYRRKSSGRRSVPARLGPPALIYLDTHMLCGVYQECGICVRHYCGAEPPRDIEPPGLVPTVGGRDRASTSYAAADRVKAPASAARGRFRGIHGGCTAPSLPTETRPTSGGRCMAGSVPSVLVRSRGCRRTSPRPHGSINTNEKEEKEKKMTDREPYAPGPASGARVRQEGEKWTLILVRELHHPPAKVWEALTDPAQLREWAPFDADGSLGTVGTTVKLTTVGAPTPHITETTVTRADSPTVHERPE